jgi:hypothetical protein
MLAPPSSYWVYPCCRRCVLVFVYGFLILVMPSAELFSIRFLLFRYMVVAAHPVQSRSPTSLLSTSYFPSCTDPMLPFRGGKAKALNAVVIVAVPSPSLF